MDATKLEQFEPLFFPRSHVVIGASANPFKFGGIFLRTLLNFGPRGKLLVVNPQESEIAGLETYPTVRDIPYPVDFASIVVPARAVPPIVEDCLAKGIKGVQILSAGFSEAGEESKGWEREIAAVASRGIRVIGPNCFGVYSPAGGLTIPPGVNLPRESGPVAFFCQSGGHAIRIPRRAGGMGIRFSQVVSYGNACDINECDLLEYFCQDPETKIISAYLEGVKDGPRFFRLLKDVTRHKPVIIWKGGLTESGSRAVHSHTASLGGEVSTWNALFRQTGAVSANNLEELVDTILAFVHLPPRSGRRICVVGGGGAIGVAAADTCERVGLNVPPFSPGLHAKLAGIVPAAGGSARNPVDVGSPFPPPPMLKEVLETVKNSGEVDALIVDELEYTTMRNPEPAVENEPQPPAPDNIRVLVDAGKENANSPVPLIVVMPVEAIGADVLEMEGARRRIRDHFLSAGIPVYLTLESAARALMGFTGYYRYLERFRQP